MLGCVACPAYWRGEEKFWESFANGGQESEKCAEGRGNVGASVHRIKVTLPGD